MNDFIDLELNVINVERNVILFPTVNRMDHPNAKA